MTDAPERDEQETEAVAAPAADAAEEAPAEPESDPEPPAYVPALAERTAYTTAGVEALKAEGPRRPDGPVKRITEVRPGAAN